MTRGAPMALRGGAFGGIDRACVSVRPSLDHRRVKTSVDVIRHASQDTACTGSRSAQFLAAFLTRREENRKKLQTETIRRHLCSAR